MLVKLTFERVMLSKGVFARASATEQSNRIFSDAPKKAIGNISVQRDVLLIFAIKIIGHERGRGGSLSAKEPD